MTNVSRAAEVINKHLGWNGTLGTMKTIEATLQAAIDLNLLQASGVDERRTPDVCPGCGGPELGNGFFVAWKDCTGYACPMKDRPTPASAPRAQVTDKTEAEPSLEELLKQSAEAVKRMTPAERAAMYQAQRESWVRGEMGMDETTVALPSTSTSPSAEDRERAREFVGDLGLELYKTPGQFEAIVGRVATLISSIRAEATAVERWSFDMTKAPRDGTLLQLLIAHDEVEGSECDGGFENENYTRVMGFNNGADDGEDVWKFPGWDWCHDCIIEQGCGKPVAWALMLAAPSDELIAAAIRQAHGEG